MKVAITSNTSWYLYNFRRNTIRELINKGYEVLAVAPKDDYSRKLSELGCEFREIDIDQSGTNPIKDALTFLEFFKIYILNKPDIILNFTPKNNIYSTLAGWFLGKPCVNNVSGLGALFIKENFSTHVARYLYKVTQKKAKKIFFQNDDDMQLFIDKNMAPAYLTERLPGSGVDLERFKVVEAKNDGVIKFILIARMLYDKGIKEYVDAAKIIQHKYKNTEFNLLGFLDVNNPSAVSSAVMQQWVDEGIIRYLGVSDCVEEEIAKVDCVVLPSYREGVPKTLLEAGAMGKPIVTTNSIGCRDVVDEGVNGFLCEPKNVEDLAEKLEKIILMTHQERLTMGIASRQKIEREFDEKIVIHKYLDAVANVQRCRPE